MTDAAPPHYTDMIGGPVDPAHRALRDALGRFATGVTIAAAIDASGAPVGLTVNSFASVSLEPPLVLFCLDKTSENIAAFRAGTGFAISVLGADQEDVSHRFATPAPARFDGVAWEAWETGAPLLTTACARFDCRTEQIVEAGDHIVLIGRVARFDVDAGRAALIYADGAYRRLD